jgi:hypothetical protein
MHGSLGECHCDPLYTRLKIGISRDSERAAYTDAMICAARSSNDTTGGRVDPLPESGLLLSTRLNLSVFPKCVSPLHLADACD